MSSLQEEPKPKKRKVKEEQLEENDETGEVEKGDLEAGGNSKDGEEAAEALRNDEGEAYFELSKTRRVTVRAFKGRVLVDFREVSRSATLHITGNRSTD